MPVSVRIAFHYSHRFLNVTVSSSINVKILLALARKAFSKYFSFSAFDQRCVSACARNIIRKTAKSSPVNVGKFVLLRFGTFEHALLVQEVVLSDDVVELKLLLSSVDEYFLEGLRCFLLFFLLRDGRPTGGLKSGGSALLGPPRTVPPVERVVSLVFFSVFHLA